MSADKKKVTPIQQATIDKIVEYHIQGVGLGEIARMYQIDISKVEDIILEALQQKMTVQGDLIEHLKRLHIARAESVVNRIMPVIMSNKDIAPGKQGFTQLVGTLLDLMTFEQEVAKGNVKDLDLPISEDYNEILTRCKQVGIDV
jgi:hypothetical protein